ncbi:MAG: ABC transporter permease, partial [Planctomycetaceae bacterium]|nr:ABC transporter permease [Planctomycetaceae bacterium]
MSTTLPPPQAAAPSVDTGQAAPAPEPMLTVIERRSGWRALDLGDLWRYRELLYFFTWRDVKVKYKQTVLGVAWTVLQPVVTMIIFTVIFGRLVGLDQNTGAVPYPVFVFAGLLPWTLFAQALGGSGNSVLASSGIITKIYFPRLLIPVASIGASLVDFATSFVVLLVLMAAYGVLPGVEVLLLPPLLLLLLMAALAVGIVSSALSVRYRDFRYLIPFAVQTLLYLTPVIYPVTIIPDRFRWLIAINPMTGVIDGFRYALLGQPL